MVREAELPAAVPYTVDRVAVGYRLENTVTRVAVQGPLSVVPWVNHRREVPPVWPDMVTEPGTVDFDHVEVRRPPPRPKELLDRTLVGDFPHPKSFVAVAAVELVEAVAGAVVAVGAVVALNTDLVRPIELANVRYHLYITHMELMYLKQTEFGFSNVNVVFTKEFNSLFK